MKSSSEAWEYPREFVDRMGALLGKELPAFLAALSTPEPGLRVNTLRLSPERFEELSSFPVKRLTFPAEGFIVRAEERPGRHPYHAAGLYYLQDPGAMVVSALAGAQPGERVLDVSAAPGGKATHLAALMRNAGLLVANDVNRKRALELDRNLERLGVRHAVVTSEPVERLAQRLEGFFDRVVLDAPCSGESMFHKSEAARAEWSVEAVRGCARRQSDLLREAAALVRPGGVLVYSTCTFAPEENEEVVERFLREEPAFETDAIDRVVPGAESFSSSRAEDMVVGYRVWPHRFPGSGHFVARMKRVGGAGPASREGSGRDRPGSAGSNLSRPSRQAISLFRSFMEATYPGRSVDPDRLAVRGSMLFELPTEVPPLQGLHVVSPGVALGSVRGDRFEPAHGLALTTDPTLSPNRVELGPSDPRVHAYLEGRPIEDPGAPGWLPVTVDGFALGWGKRVGRVVKNHYPKGLRRLG